MNFPYSRGNPKRWTAKAFEASSLGALVVGLAPVKTDTAWWHQYVLGPSLVQAPAEGVFIHRPLGVRVTVEFLRGRLEFLYKGKRVGRARFPSAVVIWEPQVGPHLA